ncbi:hypothetical protein HYW99_03970 [Candidatus Woesearchaeota archaeon]|nr:hypothetical protein [Candidatus Woesearchaeota archaeon]
MISSKKGDNMEILDSKRGFVTHPVMLFLIGVVIGIVITILWAKQLIAISFPFC